MEGCHVMNAQILPFARFRRDFRFRLAAGGIEAFRVVMRTELWQAQDRLPLRRSRKPVLASGGIYAQNLRARHRHAADTGI
jgi:hypothetical protein